MPCVSLFLKFPAAGLVTLVAAEYRGGTFKCCSKKGAFSALHRRLLAKSLFANKETF